MRVPSPRHYALTCSVLLLATGGCGRPRAPAPPVDPCPPASPEPTPSAAHRPIVPILMYHHVCDPPPDAGGYAAQLYVRPAAFAEQMAYLADAGYEPLTAGELVAALAGERELPPKPAVLTFDDGYADFRTAAWPVLRRHAFPATLFVSVNAVGTPGHLTWEQLRGLHAAGIEVASHGMTHRSLTGLAGDAVRRELADSKRRIEAELNAPVRAFAYPGGDHNPHVAAAVEAAGYDAAVTADLGVVQDPARRYELKRSRIKLRHTLDLFKARIGAPS